MNNMIKTCKILVLGSLAVGLLAPSWEANAEVKVITHPAIADSSVDAATLVNIFLKKSSALPSGAEVMPVDQETGEAPRDEFYTKVVKKNATQLKSYWSGIVFAGKGMPPKALLDSDEVVEFVAKTPNAIGYVGADADVSKVKTLLSIP